MLLVMRRSLDSSSLASCWACSGPCGVRSATPVLYYVDPRDPSVAAVVVSVLAVAAIVASLLPAWRVTKIDPTVALSAE